MPNYCKNCGASITENDQICPDCGRPLKAKPMKFCPNCGEKLINNPKFCESCGCKINNSQPEEDGFFKRHQTPIIIIGAVLILAVIAAVALSTITIYSTQEVQVDTFNFEIPGNFEENVLNSLSENDKGIKTESKFWEDGDEFIEIDVMYSANGYVDANKINDGMGGQKESMFGYEGYYNELSDAYTFSFVKDNKLCTVYTSNLDLFDQIEVL